MLLALPISLGAQSDTLWNRFSHFYNHPFRSAKPSSFLQVEADYHVDATFANNVFLWKVSTKQYLDNDLIRQNADRARAKNLFGIDNSFSVSYYNFDKGFLKKDSLYWFVRYGFRDQGGVSYSDDFFRLIGLGNYEFQGDTANADGLSFQRSRYDYLDFGLIKYFPNRSNLSVSLGVTRGIRLIDLKANQLSVYTEEYGTSTNWAIDMNARLTPALEQTLADYHGMGAQISADYKGLLGPEGAYAVGIHNLGFVQWKGSEYSKKANFTYDGWYIPDWNDLEGNGKEAFDSVAALFRPDSTGFTKTRFLPAYAYAEYTMKFRKRQALTFRFDQVFNQVMTPRITVEHLFFWSRFYTTTRLSFGGYGRFNWTQDIGYQRGRHLFHLQLYGIDGYIVPSKSSGLGAGFRYGINF